MLLTLEELKLSIRIDRLEIIKSYDGTGNISGSG